MTVLIEICFLFLLLTVWKTQEEKIQPSWGFCVYTWEVNRWCRQEHSWSKVRNKYIWSHIGLQSNEMYISYIFYSFCVVGTPLTSFRLWNLRVLLQWAMKHFSLVMLVTVYRSNQLPAKFGDHLSKCMVSHSKTPQP